MGAIRHTANVRARVIEEFRKTGRVDLATATVGVDREAHYRWLKQHKDYAAAFEEARQPVAQMLEDEAVKRAMASSDQLLMFMLEHRNPAVFRRQVAEQVGSATTINLVVMDAGADPKPIAPTNGHPPLQITVSET